MLKEKEIKEMIKALDNIFDKCEEIDNHLPESYRTNYKMIYDYTFIKGGLQTAQDRLNKIFDREIIK